MSILKKRMFGLDEGGDLPTYTLAVRTLSGQTSGAGLCAIGILSRACYVDCAVVNEINALDKVYGTNGVLFAGNNKYFLIGISDLLAITYNVKIDNSGVITAITSC